MSTATLRLDEHKILFGSWKPLGTYFSIGVTGVLFKSSLTLVAATNQEVGSGVLYPQTERLLSTNLQYTPRGTLL